MVTFFRLRSSALESLMSAISLMGLTPALIASLRVASVLTSFTHFAVSVMLLVTVWVKSYLVLPLYQPANA